ncbi:MAG TPA: hypothetical protein VHG93_06065 [Longimicrobium sp.]|nr:hypothetical protein [Longimicrobium sp.]
MVGLQQVGAVWRVVYVGESTGEYRLEFGGVAVNTVTRRWRTAEMLKWQDERVVDDDVFSLPTPYTVDGNRLIMHYGPTTGEHGEPIPAEDRVYTRR